jgi:hypothetical protein
MNNKAIKKTAVDDSNRPLLEALLICLSCLKFAEILGLEIKSPGIH